jgi:hypothetical protein
VPPSAPLLKILRALEVDERRLRFRELLNRKGARHLMVLRDLVIYLEQSHEIVFRAG